MAEYQINNPEDLIPCPYDKAHMVRASRMQYHLIKCRKNHDATEFVTCPFNARHEVYKVEARYHQAVCPDRTRIAHIIVPDEDSDTLLKGCTDLPQYKPKHAHHHGGENWEDDIPSNPRVGVDTSLLERRQHFEDPPGRLALNTAGLTVAERRELYFRQKQAAERREEETHQLRRPHNPSQAYAIHMQQQQQLQQQEQQQQRQQQDIYQFVLQKQKERAIAAGRGSSIYSGLSGQPQLNGASVASTRPGLGRGVPTLRPGVPGVLGLGRGDGDAGRGVSAGGYPAMGRASPLSTVRASVPQHSSELISQPPCPAFSAGRGQPLGMNSNMNSMASANDQHPLTTNGVGQVRPAAMASSDRESDDGQWADAPVPSWVGGGYAAAAVSGVLDTDFGSSMASGAYPGSVSSDASTSTGVDTSSGSEVSASSRTEDRRKSLKKVRKILRQIDALEKRREQGHRLNDEEVAKLNRKWELKMEEEELLNQLEVLSVD